MSSSTLRAMSNTGFLFFFSTCSVIKLDKRQAECSVNDFGEKQEETQSERWCSLPPQELPQKSVKHCEDKIHQQQAVQFLPYNVLPALKKTTHTTESWIQRMKVVSFKVKTTQLVWLLHTLNIKCSKSSISFGTQYRAGKFFTSM